LQIHESAKKKGTLYGWGIAVGIIAFSFLIWGVWGIMSFLPAPFIGTFGTTYIENRLVRKQDIFTKKDGAERSELIQELIIDGWSFDPPTA
jgi:hypothetical protein